MAAAAILKNRKITISRPRFVRFRRNLVQWCSLTLLNVPTVKNFIIQDGGGRHLEKSINRDISAAVGSISAKFGTMTVWPSWPSPPLKIWNLENPKWRRSPSWKIEKSQYIGRGLCDYDEIWHSDALWPSWTFRRLQIRNFENPRLRRPPSWKIEKSPYLGRSSSDIDEIWPDDTVRPSWRVRQWKI